ncbi:MAG: aminotransferase class I/II-fold pyridoxal phosphate-dependent enzyme [Clostridia bacterium]|nr:aminotransferase class I/II-fold pyridoxal phosphate-dependent enzyme [Clostridia bacterium]
MPEGIKKAIAFSILMSDRYPDPFCRELREKISHKESIPSAYVLCGNGAADLIYRSVYALKPKKALVACPTFSEYEAVLTSANCKTERYFLRDKNDFTLDEGFLDEIRPDIDMVFLCNPNNPTGLVYPRAFLMKILLRCEQVDALLFLDECFGDFLDEPDDYSLKREITSHRNLIILKSFTKMFAMAGVRLGCCFCGDTGLIEKIRSSGQPWSVSSLAQSAGLAALDETGFAEKTRRLIKAERTWLSVNLKKLGLRTINGQANFIMFRCDAPLNSILPQKGILIRCCGNFAGLDETWYRAAVKTRQDNKMLIEAIKEAAAHG